MIDVPTANGILPHLGDPQFAQREEAIASADPALSAADVLDLALAEAVLELRCTLNRQTFEFLKWKVVAARARAEAAREAIIEARAERAAAQDRLSRHYHDAEWEVWSVTEIAGNARSRPGARCLIFASATTVRRVWDYPPDWRELSDTELERLSWNR
jgi:hypothetical protein